MRDALKKGHFNGSSIKSTSSNIIYAIRFLSSLGCYSVNYPLCSICILYVYNIVCGGWGGWAVSSGDKWYIILCALVNNGAVSPISTHMHSHSYTNTNDVKRTTLKSLCLYESSLTHMHVLKKRRIWGQQTRERQPQ